MKKLFTLAMICFIAASMQAKIYYVTANATTVATVGIASDWNNPVTLASTISIATTATDSIWVKAGTYFVDRAVAANKAAILINSGVKQIFGGFAGTETKLNQRSRTDMDGNGIIEPWEFTNQTILDGANMSDYATPVTSRKELYITTSTILTGSWLVPNRKTIISIEGSANHIVDGVVVQNGKYDGDSGAPGINISVAGTVRNCIVRKCFMTRKDDLSNGGSQSDVGAVRAASPLAVVDGCLVEDNIEGPLLPGSYNCCAGVDLAQGTLSNSVVRNNISYARTCNVVSGAVTGFATGELAGLGLTAPVAAAAGSISSVGVALSGSGAGKKAPIMSNCIVANNEGVVYDPISTTVNISAVGIYANNTGVIMNCTVVNNKAGYANLNTTNTLPNPALEGIGVYIKANTYTTGTPALTRNNIASIYNCIVLGNTATAATLATKADISVKTNAAYDPTENGSAVTTSSTLAPFNIMDVKNCIVGGASINCDQLGSSGTVIGNDNLVSASLSYTAAQKMAVQTQPTGCTFTQTTAILKTPSTYIGYSLTDASIKTANWRLLDGTFISSGTVVNTVWNNYNGSTTAIPYTYASPTTDLLGNQQGSNPAIGALLNSGGGVYTINKNVLSENATIHILGGEIRTDIIEPSITVYNTAGLRVKQVSKTNNLSIADLSAGVYIVSAGNGILKFVK
jgi:hypothetical protein